MHLRRQILDILADGRFHSGEELGEELGGAVKMFRPHRDVRFSKDTRPYKTHAAAQFRHRRGRDVHAPGFYLHLEPGGCFAGLGVWHPEPPTLDKIRQAIVEEPGGYRKAVGGARFRKRFEVGGESLRRPPRGYDPEHPLIDL